MLNSSGKNAMQNESCEVRGIAELWRAAAIKDKIELLQAELTKVLGGHEVGNGSTASPTSKTGRRKMSAAGRAMIAAAAKAPWAKVKATGKNRL